MGADLRERDKISPHALDSRRVLPSANRVLDALAQSVGRLLAQVNQQGRRVGVLVRRATRDPREHGHLPAHADLLGADRRTVATNQAYFPAVVVLRTPPRAQQDVTVI